MSPELRAFFHSIGQKAQKRAGRLADKHIARMDKLLLAAGEPRELKGIEVFGIQLVSMVVFPVFWAAVLNSFGFASFLFEGPKQVLTYLALMAFGFFFPVMNLRERMRKRHHLIALQLPDTLDLLTISVEAGLDFGSAMRRVVEKQPPGPLKEEWERFFRKIDLGTPRRTALRELADRIQSPELSAVVSALIQADRLGISVAPVLRAQSDMLRIRRVQRAEKAAQEAPVKMLAPLMICILPSVFIMVLAPIIIQMIRNLSP